jgi:thymidylate synthase (FAD)
METQIVGHTTSLMDGFSDHLLCSYYAKLCYRSFDLNSNSNLTRIREAEETLKGVIDSGHGSVLEHFSVNFVSYGVSRVFTHELVRHRVGTAYSQTSGRYCTVEDAELVLPPVLSEIKLPSGASISDDMNAMLAVIKDRVAIYRQAAGLDDATFERKKELTSAFRRLMPNGANNEIGWTMNIRSLRNVIEMRTSPHAEWEIREVFRHVAALILKRWPVFMYGGQCVNGHWTGLCI